MIISPIELILEPKQPDGTRKISGFALEKYTVLAIDLLEPHGFKPEFKWVHTNYHGPITPILANFLYVGTNRYLVLPSIIVKMGLLHSGADQIGMFGAIRNNPYVESIDASAVNFSGRGAQGTIVENCPNLQTLVAGRGLKDRINEVVNCPKLEVVELLHK